MKRLIICILVLLALFAWAAHRSGAIERVETSVRSSVPGVPDRTSVEYRFRRDRFERYVRSFWR
ncbi:MAG: hypothetical protein PHN82_05035 [bacterium]|nr:hypothetical protein [bacterium]